MAVKFMTVKGSNTLTANPYYIGIPQHERVIGKREAYEIAAKHTGYKATAVKAVFMALKEFIRENQARGNITYIDEVASVRNVVRGSFTTLTGPWVKGKNLLLETAVEMDPFKSLLADIVPTNNTEGAKPVINTVLDDSSGQYDLIQGTNVFSIAGSDLGIDATKADEKVILVAADGKVTECEITYADLGNVKAKAREEPASGEYTLKVFTRSGMGEDFGVKTATRKVTVE